MSEAQQPALTGNLTGNRPQFELASARRRRGQGAVFRRRDGRWEAQLRLPGGSRRSFYGHTRAECTARLDEARWALEHGLPLRTREQTLREYLQECWE